MKKKKEGDPPSVWCPPLYGWYLYYGLLRLCHYEAHVDSLYGIVDAIEHGLYSSCIGSVEQKWREEYQLSK